ncbi:C40 family peptidase [Cutibacterium acnes]|uniref:C40 family peptidase n=1 Tax=Cutibacterium acnes TaxID=1747 RepID=UPI001BE00106|nr:NlpC/P60 family protein [Cutibacterium acnes]MBU5175973.1 C40 family peptidase [Cutibacterium acnes]MCM4180616.1 NPL/P60 family protein [Cutibacterium acnes P15]MCP9437561.1 NlpC/P60 family protein [Cutibacterium acnes]MCU7485300.1 NPL/P60 family protein [Cutibacterium acnes 19B2]MCU7487610.1 NPL/P60 family protein [Cutibacterium acnes 19B1]
MSGSAPRRGRGVAFAAITGAILLGTVASVDPGAQAAPDPIDQAKVRLAQLDEQTSKVQEDYTEAQAALDKAQKDLDRSQRDLKTQSDKVATMRKALGRVALSDYQSGGGVSMTTQLVASGDSGQFLSKLATIQNATERTSVQFQDFQAEQARLKSMKSQAEADRATIESQRNQQAKLLADAKKKEQEAKQVVDRLTAQQRAELKRQQAAEAQAAAAHAVSRSAGRPTDQQSALGQPSSSSTQSTQASQTGSQVPIPDPSHGVSSRAQSALNFALAQLGKPYIWGGTGPTGYDCSGLMMASWGKAGVSLPRTAAAQYAAGTPVSTSDLQPGDLVFFYPGITHVGMYIGDGKFIHASSPRTGIKVSVLAQQPSYQGARRFG